MEVLRRKFTLHLLKGCKSCKCHVLLGPIINKKPTPMVSEANTVLRTANSGFSYSPQSFLVEFVKGKHGRPPEPRNTSYLFFFFLSYC